MEYGTTIAVWKRLLSCIWMHATDILDEGNPRLAPVGVLLAVLGYAVGTYGAWLCTMLMQYMSSG